MKKHKLTPMQVFLLFGKQRLTPKDLTEGNAIFVLASNIYVLETYMLLVYNSVGPYYALIKNKK